MKRTSFGSVLFLALVLIFLYLPIVVVVVYSFNDNPARIPLEFTGWTTRWYGELFAGKGGYADALILSLKVALWSVGLSVAVGTLGAVGMVQSALRTGKAAKADSLLESVAILPIMIPEIILGLAFMVIFDFLGLKGNTLRLVTAHTTFCIPYVFLSVKSRLVSMDTALFDAARDLGATQWRILGDITLPLCAPAIISGAFLAFAMSMDDFVISFFVYGVGEGTLPLKIYSSVKTGVSLRVNALCTLMILAVFLVVAFSQYMKALRQRKEALLARS
ncbi:MAG: ABC transporter permease [Clostridiales bacterium]|nr:ABC transporter permease [Clostridiales bacterium]